MLNLGVEPNDLLGEILRDVKSILVAIIAYLIPLHLSISNNFLSIFLAVLESLAVSPELGCVDTSIKQQLEYKNLDVCTLSCKQSHIE